jgi:hypothetical protein
MISYLADVLASLTSKKGGIDKNAAMWDNLTVKSADVSQKMLSINEMNTRLESAKQQLQIVTSEAHALCDEAWNLDTQIENLAKGIHGDVPEKLIEYGIKPKKSSAPKEAPSKILAVTVEDDSDGEGFVVSTTPDSQSDYYEWQKGYGSNAADKNTIPELKNFKTTKKSSFADDDVPKGVRVFYRVRAANRIGTGPWSEPVSKVQ